MSNGDIPVQEIDISMILSHDDLKLVILHNEEPQSHFEIRKIYR